MFTIQDAKIKIEKIIDDMINNLEKCPEFEALKVQVYELKNGTLNAINNAESKTPYFYSNDIKYYISEFETNVLELLASYTLREKKTSALKKRLIKLLTETDRQDLRYNPNTTNMMHILEGSSKDKNYRQIYTETFTYIKSLERKIILYKIQQLKSNLNKIRVNKIETLKQSDGLDTLDEMFRISKLYMRISKLLKLCEQGLINFDDLTQLYEFDFSKGNETLIDCIEEKINLPNSTNILIDLNPSYNSFTSFKHLQITQNELNLINVDNEKNEEYCFDDNVKIFDYYQTLDDFFYKADLIGSEALFYSYAIIIAKCDDTYLFYDPEAEIYFFNKDPMHKIVYTANNIRSWKTMKLLEEIEEYDIDALKQRIVSYVTSLEEKHNKDANVEMKNNTM